MCLFPLLFTVGLVFVSFTPAFTITLVPVEAHFLLLLYCSVFKGHLDSNIGETFNSISTHTLPLAGETLVLAPLQLASSPSFYSSKTTLYDHIHCTCPLMQPATAFTKLAHYHPYLWFRFRQHIFLVRFKNCGLG